MTVTASTQIPANQTAARLDKIMAELLPQYSRSRLQTWLKDGYIKIDGVCATNKTRVYGGELVELSAPAEPNTSAVAEPIDLDIIYADAHILVINKAVGMVVHPAAGNWSGTLLNGLLHYDATLAQVPRGGIVHRLDKDTSGLLVVARSLEAHKNLVEQLQARSVGREYDAICCGRLERGGRIEANIGRHAVNRQKMAVRQVGGKQAITNYECSALYRHHTLLRCKLETGRTHQIRVHLSHLGFALVGDQVYGGRPKIANDLQPQLQQALAEFNRQALHAARLELLHPHTGKTMSFSAPPPSDFARLIELLEDDYFIDDLDFGADASDDDWNEADYDVEIIYEP